jgi:hypothetical protein
MKALMHMPPYTVMAGFSALKSHPQGRHGRACPGHPRGKGGHGARRNHVDTRVKPAHDVLECVWLGCVTTEFVNLGMTKLRTGARP